VSSAASRGLVLHFGGDGRLRVLEMAIWTPVAFSICARASWTVASWTLRVTLGCPSRRLRPGQRGRAPQVASTVTSRKAPSGSSSSHVVSLLAVRSGIVSSYQEGKGLPRLLLVSLTIERMFVILGMLQWTIFDASIPCAWVSCQRRFQCWGLTLANSEGPQKLQR